MNADVNLQNDCSLNMANLVKVSKIKPSDLDKVFESTEFHRETISRSQLVPLGRPRG